MGVLREVLETGLVFLLGLVVVLAGNWFAEETIDEPVDIIGLWKREWIETNMKTLQVIVPTASLLGIYAVSMHKDCMEDITVRAVLFNMIVLSIVLSTWDIVYVELYKTYLIHVGFTFYAFHRVVFVTTCKGALRYVPWLMAVPLEPENWFFILFYGFVAKCAIVGFCAIRLWTQEKFTPFSSSKNIMIF